MNPDAVASQLGQFLGEDTRVGGGRLLSIDPSAADALSSSSLDEIFESPEEQEMFVEDYATFWDAHRRETNPETAYILAMDWMSWGAPMSWSSSSSITRLGDIGLITESREWDVGPQERPTSARDPRWWATDAIVGVVKPWDSTEVIQYLVVDYLERRWSIGEGGAEPRVPSSVEVEVPLAADAIESAFGEWIASGLGESMFDELSQMLDDDALTRLRVALQGAALSDLTPDEPAAQALIRAYRSQCYRGPIS